MRSDIRLSILAVVSALMVTLVASSAAQQIRFEDFSSVANLQFNGSSHQATWQSQRVLRLTDGISPFARGLAGTAYFNVKQPLTSGFTTWFEFQIHNPTVCCTPGDGLAFIIQNSTATDPLYGASGAGLTALGAANGGMGYAGINNNLAVEFDIRSDPWDPNSNHAAVQSCGPNTNTPVHLPGDYTIGQDHHVESCLLTPQAINTTIPTLGGTCSGGICTNGAVHQVVIEYTPPAGDQPGTLMVWLDPPFIPGTHTPAPGAVPALNVPYNVNALSLDNGSAWVGFTASQPIGQGTAQDILAWEFTPHTATEITEVIQPGGIPTVFAFGAHELVVTYPLGFTNPDGILMTVLATPWSRNTFFAQRLLGTPFADEVCTVYLGTGNNCIVYSVTCHDPVTGSNLCPSEQQPTIEIDSSFYTSDPISPTNADFLEAEPIGSNNWMSIFTSYTSNPIDGTVSGKGSGFSDIVTTFHRNKP